MHRAKSTLKGSLSACLRDGLVSPFGEPWESSEARITYVNLADRQDELKITHSRGKANSRGAK